MFNQFNLGSDLMEPFRPLVDKKIMDMKLEKFETDEKHEIISLINKEVRINNKIEFLNNAVKIYCKSVFEALNEKDVSVIRFVENEL